MVILQGNNATGCDFFFYFLVRCVTCSFPHLKCFPCKRALAPQLNTDFISEKLLFSFSDLLIKCFPSRNALLYDLRIEVAASREECVFHTKERIGLLGVFPLL